MFRRRILSSCSPAIVLPKATCRQLIQIPQSLAPTLLNQESQAACPARCRDGLESGLILTKPLRHKEEWQVLEQLASFFSMPRWKRRGNSRIYFGTNKEIIL